MRAGHISHTGTEPCALITVVHFVIHISQTLSAGIFLTEHMFFSMGILCSLDTYVCRALFQAAVLLKVVGDLPAVQLLITSHHPST